MKTIGIIGGLGPEATIDYYKEIIGRFNEINGNGSLNYPEIIIYSVNMSRLIGYMNARQYPAAISYMSECIAKLQHAGADFAAISANTPHLLFNEIQEKSPLPLISIVESAKDEALSLSLKNPGLIGTKFTMKATFYQEVFQKAGISVVVPDDADIEIINEKIFKELELGIFKDETKNLILEKVEKMLQRYNIDSLILGCTEFPIMFNEPKYLGIPFLNTTRIHVNAIIKECLQDK
jgi:aspartate racemase